MNKNIKKVFILLMMSVFILLIYKVIDIYAVFHSEVEANVQLEQGVWNIIINGTDITTGTKTEFVIDQISTTENSHVKPGKLAPGLSGSFEILINPENTNVSVRYDITLNQDEIGKSNLKIKSIEETVQNYQLIKTAENTYTGIMLLDDINKGINHKIKMEIEWVADEEISNEADTILGTDVSHKLQIPITVHAIQYLGEEIIPVAEEETKE